MKSIRRRNFKSLQGPHFSAYIKDTICCITVPEGIRPCTGNFHHPDCRRQHLFRIRPCEHIGADIDGFRPLGILAECNTRYF